MYCDDSHKSSSGPRCVEGLEERFSIAALWGSFFGVVHRTSKCKAAVGKNTKEADANKRTMEVDNTTQIRIRDEHKGTQEAIPMIDAYQDARALGVQVSIAGYSSEAADHAETELGVTTRAIWKAPNIGQLALAVAESVAWSRLKYRLQFTYVWPETVDRICSGLRKVVLVKLGLHSGAARAAVDTLLWTKGGAEMGLERLSQLHSMLNAGGEVQMGLEGSIQELQKYMGIEEPVMETKLMKCSCKEMGLAARMCTTRGIDRCETSPGWEGSWTGMILHYLSNSKVSITGG
jgi:hypothetical protein